MKPLMCCIGGGKETFAASIVDKYDWITLNFDDDLFTCLRDRMPDLFVVLQNNSKAKYQLLTLPSYAQGHQVSVHGPFSQTKQQPSIYFVSDRAPNGCLNVVKQLTSQEFQEQKFENENVWLFFDEQLNICNPHMTRFIEHDWPSLSRFTAYVKKYCHVLHQELDADTELHMLGFAHSMPSAKLNIEPFDQWLSLQQQQKEVKLSDQAGNAAQLTIRLQECHDEMATLTQQLLNMQMPESTE